MGEYGRTSRQQALGGDRRGHGTSGINRTVEPRIDSAPGKIRTCDLSLRRRALYPLSYGRGGDRCGPDVGCELTVGTAPLSLDLIAPPPAPNRPPPPPALALARTIAL